MKLRLKLAIRNVFRNVRRTIINVIMIAGGLTAIVVYRGFSHHVIGDLEELATKGQYGHLQIANNKLWQPKPDDSPKDRSFSPDPELIGTIAKMPGVKYVSPRLSFSGLISNGEHSLGGQGVGFDTSAEIYLRDSLPLTEGKKLTADTEAAEVLVGSGLQEQLSAKIGDSLTLLSYTHDGSVNALDVELVGVFRTGLAQLDNSTFYTSLKTAQQLLDTASVERLIIMLNQTAETERYERELKNLMKDGFSVKAWTELAVFYRQVEKFHGLQNLIVECIILLLALLAIANTVSMSISERTGEIGTLRAMGDTRLEILMLFLLEGLVLGAIGGVIGLGCGYFAAKILTHLEIQLVLPGASAARAVVFDILPSAFVRAFLLTCCMSVLATAAAAWRASKLNIVDALKRNI